MHALGLSRKRKGDLAEVKVATDLLGRGYKVAFPYGEDCDYDLILGRGDRLERVQVKYARAQDDVITLRPRSHSLTNGKVRVTKRYTVETIDWLAIYEASGDRCYYVPAAELGEGNICSTCGGPAKNGQRRGIREARAYAEI